MAGVVSAFFKSIMAPRLYRIYHRAGTAHNLGEVYAGNVVEGLGDFAVGYLIPSCAIYCVWQRRWQYFLYLGVLIVSSYAIRSAGRTFSPTYQTFLQILKRSHQTFNTENAELLRRYDFDFKAWPASYVSQQVSSFSSKTSIRDGQKLAETSTICWFVGWLVAHSFGIRLIYPGTFFSYLLRAPLEEARAKQVVEKNGIRAKVRTVDGNGIDTMFFDRRSEINPKGKTLVITFEGNAGFYEIGMVETPLEAGYSVLGFNHPGFAGSSGAPYPQQELNAAEAIFDFAVSELGFKEEEIVFYAWSIGGFASSHLAAAHPKIKALVLDATFDDVLVLALPKMPSILSSVVRSTIRNHVNLHISKEVRGYMGPIRLIRRTEDEIIADPPGVLANNRGNFLLTDIIRQRYPEYLDNPEAEQALSDWLARPHVLDPNLTEFRMSLSNSDLKISSDPRSNKEKARIVVQIADKLLTDFLGSHCVPLPPSYFQLPWDGTMNISNVS